LKKQFDWTKDNITASECNSGSTTFYRTPIEYNEIVVWRAEEWKKVFLHELIHATRLDKMACPSISHRDVLLNREFPHYNYTIQEAYSEILATFMYILQKRNSNNWETIRNDILDTNAFLGMQVNKIADFIEGNRDVASKFLKTPKIRLDSNTNTGSYYVLKSAYLWSIKDSLREQNVSSLLQPFFKKNNSEYFYDIFQKALGDGGYSNWLSKIYRSDLNIEHRNHLRLSMD
jgi:hypothetical protein